MEVSSHTSWASLSLSLGGNLSPIESANKSLLLRLEPKLLHQPASSGDGRHLLSEAAGQHVRLPRGNSPAVAHRRQRQV